MAISSDDVAKVREATDIVALLSERVALRKVGTRYSGRCPFHEERTPSFSVNSQEGLYYCFGCGASGDVITWVREIERVDFAEAVQMLASRAGVAITTTEPPELTSRKRRLETVMEKAVDWYHQRLLSSSDAAGARGYLRRERGYDVDVVKKFRLGYAPAGWDELARALRLDEATAKATGLAFVNRRGRLQDHLRERLLFPISSASGKPVAFGGRRLGTDGAKYKNSPESDLYSKSKTLYGLDLAKTDAVATDEIIICEGYTDVIGFHLSGLPRAVATCGTALTEDHVRQLRRFSRRLVLAYDADAAGQSGIARIHQWETDHDLEVWVARLPVGKDPADVARDDLEALAHAVADAQPFLGFMVDRELNRDHRTNPEARASAANRAIELIKVHPNPLVREQYAVNVATACGLRVESVMEMLGQTPARPATALQPRTDSRKPSGPRDTVVDQLDLELLRSVVANPEAATSMVGLPGLFVDISVARAAELVIASGSAKGALGSLGQDSYGAEQAELQRLLASAAASEAAADLTDVVGRAVQRSAKLRLAALEATHGASREMAELRTWVMRTLQSLRIEDHKLDALTTLLAWLIDTSEDAPSAR